MGPGPLGGGMYSSSWASQPVAAVGAKLGGATDPAATVGPAAAAPMNTVTLPAKTLRARMLRTAGRREGRPAGVSNLLIM